MHFGSFPQRKPIFEFRENPTLKKGLEFFFAEILPSENTAPYSEPFDIVSSIFSKMSLRQFFRSDTSIVEKLRTYINYAIRRG